jgi:D-alanyl-D-alanine carboxypeptidase/D-alanyl-D-alanine-endopeptidase (penicillin-binding protein 4)
MAAAESPPLAELVRQMMKASQNLYAQALLLQVGRHRQSPQSLLPDPHETAEQAALAELRDFIAEAGIAAKAVQLDDGAGLSRRSLVTPNALVDLLKYMDGHRCAGAFRSSLPVAGIDGTLRQRMIGTAAEGCVQAKTGMLANVYTLSGYVTTVAGERLAFAFMLNNHTPESSAAASADLDALAILLASLEDHSSPDARSTPRVHLGFPIPDFHRSFVKDPRPHTLSRTQAFAAPLTSPKPRLNLLSNTP